MKRVLSYTYLGTNGVLTTPIHLEGIYSVKKYDLTADSGKKLTKDNVNFYQTIIIPAEEIDDWKEVSV